VYIPGGVNSVATLAAEANAVHFVNEAYKHCKAVAADTSAMQVLEATYFFKKLPADYSNKNVMMEGVTVQENPETLAKQFISAIKQHRFWDREKPRRVPA
jgi:catalase